MQIMRVPRGIKTLVKLYMNASLGKSVMIDPKLLVSEIETENEPLLSLQKRQIKEFLESEPNRDTMVETLGRWAWSELYAVVFMPITLARSAIDLAIRGEFDIMEGLAKQIWDEARHTRYVCRLLEEFGGTLKKDHPTAEISKSYQRAFELAEKGDLLGLHAGNMLTGEASAVPQIQTVIETCERLGKYPNMIRLYRIMDRDERFHVNNGRRVVSRYAVTEELQNKARFEAKYYRDALIERVKRIYQVKR